MTSSLDTAARPPAPPELEPGSSLGRDAWQRLRKNKLALFGAGYLALFLALCLVGPVFAPSYREQNLDIGSVPPLDPLVEVKSPDEERPYQSSLWKLRTELAFGSGAEAEQLLQTLKSTGAVEFEGSAYRLTGGRHLLGTDTLGRDLFARVLYGGRISLGVALAATVVSLLIGVSYGAVAGFFGGKLDAFMMRVVDILYALPFTIFVILLMTFFGRELWLMFVAIGAVEWLTMARIVRGQILALKKMEFIEAARALGYGRGRIIFRHMIPNILGPIIVYTTLLVPAVMLLEAFLSFLGLGVTAPMSSLGSLIKDGSEKMEEYPWMLIFPGAVFSLTLFSLNFLGDGLRDALDVRSSKD